MKATVMTDDGSPQPIPKGGLTETVKFRSESDPQTRKWQLEGTDIIEDIRHRLKGEIPNPHATSENDEWIEATKPLANEQGVSELCWFLSNYLNKNMHLSYFKPEQIDIILIDFEGSLTRKFESDYKIMGIRIEDVDQVFLMIANTVWAGINRARFGGEKQFLEGTEQRMITSNETHDGNKGGGLLSKIPIIGKL